MTLSHFSSPIGSLGPVVLQGSSGGLTFVPADAPLIGLNYYDGRFLRADDLNLERLGQRRYVEFSNQAGGAGLVWGFELGGLDTPRVTLSAGLAIAPKGRVLHLPVGVDADVATLTGTSQAAEPAPASGAGFEPCLPETVAPAATVVPGSALYLVCLAAGNGLCGHAEVLGRPCDGCVTATDRPYVVDGVTLLLRPLALDVRPYALEGVTRPDTHLRSQVASAYYAGELTASGSRLSAAVLAADFWGAGAPSLAGEDVVPIGVLGWNGAKITLLDMWTARRERMESPPRSSWAGRLEQRPWPVFLAQVLQFQAQLATAPAAAPTAPARILIEQGFVELPAGGYLPVDSSGRDLRVQVQDLMGGGVDLRFCAVRRDQIPHELERAQHMDRISLLRGLRDPDAPERVDILVPDGIVDASAEERTGIGFAVDLRLGRVEPTLVRVAAAAERTTLALRGAGRVDVRGAVDARLAVAGAAPRQVESLLAFLADLLTPSADSEAAVERLLDVRPGVGRRPKTLIHEVADAVLAAAATLRREGKPGPVDLGGLPAGQVIAVGMSLRVDRDPFALAGSDKVSFDFEFEAFQPKSPPVIARFEGSLRRPASTKVETGAGEVVLLLNATPFGDAGAEDRVVTPVVLSMGEEDGRTFLRLRTPDSRVVVSVDWAGAPVDAMAALAVSPPRGNDVKPVRVASLHALEDADIGRPGGEYHDLALDALTILSGAHVPDAAYVEEQTRLLFPPAPVVTSQMRSTTDWVLFRRRRREECEGTVMPPVEVSPVTAWIRRATSEEELEELVAAVFEGSFEAADWERVDLVFEPGAATLLTPPGTWRSRYGQVGGGPSIALAGYTGMPGSQPAAYAIGRLNAMVAALDPAAVLDAGAPVDVVTDPPSELMVPGTDGSAFLISHAPEPEPGPDELEVILAVLPEGDDEIGPAVTGGDPTAVPALGSSDVMSAVGRVTADSLDISGIRDEAEAAVGAHADWGRRSRSAWLWTRTGIEEERRRTLQELAEQVVSGLGSALQPDDLTLPDDQMLEVEFDSGGAAARLYVLAELPT